MQSDQNESTPRAQVLTTVKAMADEARLAYETRGETGPFDNMGYILGYVIPYLLAHDTAFEGNRDDVQAEYRIATDPTIQGSEEKCAAALLAFLDTRFPGLSSNFAPFAEAVALDMVHARFAQVDHWEMDEAVR